MEERKRAIIIGAGPAGLTAAYELLTRAGIRPIVLEKSQYMGGIARTVNYKGNRIDIGGHRFFSKSSRVTEWLLNMLPLEGCDGGGMLAPQRKSRIYHRGRFFDYPITLGRDTLANLGAWRAFKIGLSYSRSALFPLEHEDSLEQFFINRFGREMYNTFFKAYTEKLWGVPCGQIGAEWGAQRVKGLSGWVALRGALHGGRGSGDSGIDRSGEPFLYPKFGPGQMWEEVARRVGELGGEIRTGWAADRIVTDGWRAKGVGAMNAATGERETFEGDYVFSTAPIQELMRWFDAAPPGKVLDVSDNLVYRDFITVGIVARGLKIHDDGKGPIRDQWIYVQEPDVRMGRVQIYNNWSPYLAADPSRVLLGAEYFCGGSDEIWNRSGAGLIALAKRELGKIGMIDPADVLDATVVRMEKAYPAYFGAYSRIGEIRGYVERYENLFLVGRNGLHRYNNQDHSMLTAMAAVDDVIAGRRDKGNIWEATPETGRSARS
jgi:protoporphyrinogen oxidase